MQEGNSSEQADCVVVVQQEGKIQTLLGDYLRMFLSYRYGLEWIATKDVLDGAIQVKSLGDKVKASIVIQNREVDSEQTFSALNRGGAIPLFCLVPIRLLDFYINLCVELRHIYFWDWESAFSKTAESVLSIVERTLAKSGIEGLLEGIEDEPYEALRERKALRTSLSALVHLANNMCKDLGLGYSAKEKGVYSPAVLEALGA